MSNPPGWSPKPIPPLNPGHNNKQKVNLKAHSFDDLVLKQGVKVCVYRTTYCPKVKSIDGAEHEIDCDICHGAGFVDKLPISTFAFIQQQALDKAVFAEGLYDGNTVAATFLQNVNLQYFTLVELPDMSEIIIERVKRQDGVIDVLRYPGIRVNSLTDSENRDYFEGSDFKLDGNGNIFWCAKRRPDRGQIYSLNYDSKVRFRAIRAMHVNRFAQINLNGVTQEVRMNEQWMLQKEFLIVRKDIKGNLISPNKIRDSDDTSEDVNYDNVPLPDDEYETT